MAPGAYAGPIPETLAMARVPLLPLGRFATCGAN